jgi:hypothetical protein
LKVYDAVVSSGISFNVFTGQKLLWTYYIG